MERALAFFHAGIRSENGTRKNDNKGIDMSTAVLTMRGCEPRNGSTKVRAMYAKLFAQVVASSLTENETIDVRGVFFMLLAIADREGHVMGVDRSIARIINVPDDQFAKALERLMSPDPESQSDEHDGRRVIRLKDRTGLFIVNYQKYSGIVTDEQRRAYLRQKKAEERARKKAEMGGKKGGETGGSVASTSRVRKTNRPGSLEEVIEAGKMLGATELMCKKFWEHYEGTATENENGQTVWVTGERGEKIVGNWHSMLARWRTNEEEKAAKEGQKKEAQKEPGEVPPLPVANR